MTMTLPAPNAQIAELWSEPGTRSQTRSALRSPAALRLNGASLWSSAGATANPSIDGYLAAIVRESFELAWGRNPEAFERTCPPSAELAEFSMNALREWLELESDNAAAFPLAHAAAIFLGRFIRIGGVTPQIGSNGAGGIEIEWLVAGTSLTIDIASESEILIYALDPAGAEMFSKEITTRWATSDEIFLRAEALLREMATRVVTRASLRA